MQSMLLHDPSDSCIISEILQRHSSYRNDRIENQKVILSQWNELKEMLNESLKSIKKSGKASQKNASHSTAKSKSSEQSESDQQVETNIPNVWMPALSIFADVLVQVRSNHQSSWNNLKSSEIELVNDALVDRQMVACQIHANKC